MAFPCTELKMYSLMMTANGHVDRCSIAPPIIMHTAATPMPTPKSSLGPESMLGDELLEGMCQSERGLGFSETGSVSTESRAADPLAYDQHSLVSSNTFSCSIYILLF